MSKLHYLLKSTPCRSTFQTDMTPAERNIMMEHIAYWTSRTHEGICIVFGPVMEPSETWGLGIVEVDSESDVQSLINNDPAKINSLMSYQFFPMRVGMIRE